MKNLMIVLLGVWMVGCVGIQAKKDKAVLERNQCVRNALNIPKLTPKEMGFLLGGCHQVYRMKLDRINGTR